MVGIAPLGLRRHARVTDRPSCRPTTASAARPVAKSQRVGNIGIFPCPPSRHRAVRFQTGLGARILSSPRRSRRSWQPGARRHRARSKVAHFAIVRAKILFVTSGLTQQFWHTMRSPTSLCIRIQNLEVKSSNQTCAA
ncbi:hypothetical protein Y88_3114 [Novosphingobium nitrogenifigens DSM 19370]|uniref:Uncharacterized protein n=1 Tax=Novosphingobium nitrogenifigens DSM 19370 TaxID=983920 RepID=F1ZC76_9SPHN|nr:hypothetical protein Y88_3114 [Novosphingobium nitrogenifigens DSM 19370]